MLTMKSMRILACMLCLSSCATSLLVADVKNNATAPLSPIETVVADVKIATGVVSETNNTLAKENMDKENSGYMGKNDFLCDAETQTKVCTDMDGCYCYGQ